jgi:hypothetical protein
VAPVKADSGKPPATSVKADTAKAPQIIAPPIDTVKAPQKSVPQIDTVKANGKTK